MPSKKQEFRFPGQPAGQLLEIAYGTFLQLGWTPKYAGAKTIVGYTPHKTTKYGDEIAVEAVDEHMLVKSSLVHNESFDLAGRNKKNINDFITTFEKIKLSEPQPEWSGEIERLRELTAIAAHEQAKQAEEIDKVMNFSKSNLYVTYGLIAINIGVFLLMVINGVSPTMPTGYDVLAWGANYGPLTVSGDWWRLISSVFVHIGIIHLLFNMYALYMAGVYLEPMLGKIKYTIAYLSTGIFASVASLVWHKEPVPSAGASGAIFGVYGVFLALLLTNLIPKQIRIPLLQSIAVFVVFNIMFGIQLKDKIDNSAHIGGLVSGMLIGFIYYLSLKKEEGNRSNFLAGVIAIITVAIAWFYIDSKKPTVTIEEREKLQNEIKQFGGRAGKSFLEKYEQFIEIDGKHSAILNDTTINDEQRIKKLNELVKEWDRVEKIFKEMNESDLPASSKKKIGSIEEYAAARKEEIAAINKIMEEQTPENFLKLSEIRERITEIVNRMN